MSTFGDQVFQYGGSPVNGPLTEGPALWVKPGSGSDGQRGDKPNRSLATISKAQSLMPADRNGVIYLVAEDNSASGTTNRIEGATFTFSNDGTRIQGIASGGMIGSRARISNTADTTDVSPLMTWSASNSAMANVHVLYSEDDAGDLGCFNVTGERNYFYRCHFGGIGNATQDAAGAYSLRVSGDENLFEDCVIGIDTVARGTAANSEILFAGAATRNIFRNCLILTYAEANTHQFIIAGAGSLDRWVLFENCTFINPVDSAATNMTEAFDLTAALGGSVLLKNCTLVGATEWEAGDIGEILIDGGTPAAATTGIAVEPAV